MAKLALKGEFLYPKVFEQTRDLKGPDGVWEEYGGKTTITVLLDADEVKKLVDSGSGKQVTKLSDDGRAMVRFDRPWTHGKFPQYGGAPAVVKADGRTRWDIDEDGLIGNGSQGVVHLTTYDSKGRVGTRLEGVQVLEHVPYVSAGSKVEFEDFGETKVLASTSSEEVTEETEDEMPF